MNMVHNLIVETSLKEGGVGESLICSNKFTIVNEHLHIFNSVTMETEMIIVVLDHIC